MLHQNPFTENWKNPNSSFFCSKCDESVSPHFRVCVLKPWSGNCKILKTQNWEWKKMKYSCEIFRCFYLVQIFGWKIIDQNKWIFALIFIKNSNWHNKREENTGTLLHHTIDLSCRFGNGMLSIGGALGSDFDFFGNSVSFLGFLFLPV